MAESPHQFLACDAWTTRGRCCDARSATRGDILANDDRGRTVYPRYFAKAQGAYLWDVDGKRYIDYVLGYGPVVLGHAHERVAEAVVQEIRSGHCIAPLWSPRQVELCELLTSTIPGAELAYTLKTGSDATSAAVRLARIFTGREKVVRWGYNGWHDWAVGMPAGIPASTRDNTIVLDQLNTASLGAVFERYPREIACFLTMPYEFDTVPPRELRALAEITHQYGALFVLDEMRSGFRIALGGAQQYFGVRADLVTFSKAMANGFPISALVGRRDVMNCLGQTRISSTFYASPVDMVAALTTISILQDTDAITTLWDRGSKFQLGLAALIEELDVQAEVVGYAPSPFLRFHRGQDQVKHRFYVEATRRGLLLHPDHQWFLSAAHTEEDVGFSLEVCRDALEAALIHGG